MVLLLFWGSWGSWGSFVKSLHKFPKNRKKIENI